VRLIGFIVRRLLQMIPVLIGITLLAFLFIQLLPGDPIVTMLGGKATPEVIAAAHAKYGLDDPLPTRYLLFIRNAIQGDLGTSITLHAPVRELIGDRLPPTMFLVGYATVISVIMSLPLAMLAARKADRLPDHVIRITGMVTISMPAFWLGLLFMLLFGLLLQWFPIAGWGENFMEHLHYLFLPALVIGLSMSPILIQSLRASLLEIMGAEFIEAARAKGLGPNRIMYRHVLRNALIQAVTVLAVNIGWLIGGSVVVENVFSIPGIGRLLIQSVLGRDYPTIQGLVLVFGMLIIFVNMIADLSYAVIDPRVSY
jgi:ABC-type dipeptide/oligopeptide/nickel transport system permease component